MCIFYGTLCSAIEYMRLGPRFNIRYDASFKIPQVSHQQGVDLYTDHVSSRFFQGLTLRHLMRYWIGPRGFQYARWLHSVYYLLQWRHKTSNHRHLDCQITRLFRLSKKSKLRMTLPLLGYATGDGIFPAQRGNYAETILMSWCHHVELLTKGFHCRGTEM